MGNEQGLNAPNVQNLRKRLISMIRASAWNDVGNIWVYCCAQIRILRHSRRWVREAQRGVLCGHSAVRELFLSWYTLPKLLVDLSSAVYWFFYSPPSRPTMTFHLLLLFLFSIQLILGSCFATRVWTTKAHSIWLLLTWLTQVTKCPKAFMDDNIYPFETCQNLCWKPALNLW